MSVHECKDCGGMVSSNAKACPHCGSTEHTPVSGGNGLLGLIFLVFIICVGWHAIFHRNSQEATDIPVAPMNIAPGNGQYLAPGNGQYFAPRVAPAPFHVRH
jgi:hypothetical protein